MKHFSRWSGIILVAGLIIGVTGCSAPATTADKKVTEDEYVYVKVTGSNIPKKVKKSDLAAGTVPKDVDMQLMNPESLQRSLNPSKAPGG